MKQEELNKVLKEHELWLKDRTKGEKADLYCALLMDAKLKEARLAFADLQGAILMDADLSFSDLMGARLHFADLTNADLRGAKLRGTTIGHANLTNTKFDYQIQKGLLKKIAEVVLGSRGKKPQNDLPYPYGWYSVSSCGTTYCIASWAVRLNKTAKTLSDAHSSYEVAALFTLGPEAHSMFYKGGDEVLKFLKGVLDG